MSATASCYCRSVVLAFPPEGDALVESFICHCTDCRLADWGDLFRKITASMWATNFIVKAKYVTHVKGRELLTTYSQSETIETGNTMSDSFCSQCGTLMYRVSSSNPTMLVMRVGTVDDFTLHETKLKPRLAQFCKDRVSWDKGADGVKEYAGNYFAARKRASGGKL